VTIPRLAFDQRAELIFEPVAKRDHTDPVAVARRRVGCSSVPFLQFEDEDVRFISAAAMDDDVGDAPPPRSVRRHRADDEMNALGIRRDAALLGDLSPRNSGHSRAAAGGGAGVIIIIIIIIGVVVGSAAATAAHHAHRRTGAGRVGLSRSSLWRMVKDGEFPKRRKLSSHAVGGSKRRSRND
jgi:hypothetical protein